MSRPTNQKALDKLSLAIRLLDEVNLDREVENPRINEFLREAVPLITRAIRQGWPIDEAVESAERVMHVVLP